jgi:hypothetical protein
MYDAESRRRWLERGECKRMERKTTTMWHKPVPKIQINKQLLEKVVPISLQTLQNFIKVYEMFWEGNHLCCPKYENKAIGVKSKSLIDKSNRYSISKMFITNEYNRTHSPMLRKFMVNSLMFNDVLKEADTDKRKKLDKLVQPDRAYRKAYMEDWYYEED